MAKKRGRNPVGWILLFLIFNPVVGAILLLIMGDSKKKIKQEIIAELSKKESEAKDINQLPDKNISTN